MSGAQEIREAIALPIDLVRVMECYVVKFSEWKPQVACFVGWLLCMVYASLRFNDACHVKPDSLEMRDTGLYGLAWQTKVERKRRGTRFVIAKTGLVHAEWLETWFTLFKDLRKGDRDFWMFDLNTDSEFSTSPVHYHRGLKWVRVLLQEAIDWAVGEGLITQATRNVLSHIIAKITWHSFRVTLLNLALRKGKHSEAIALQANWSQPGALVLKYARNKREVPLNMVCELVNELRKDWTLAGDPVKFDDEIIPADEPLMFYAKFPTVDRSSFKIESLKYHVRSLVNEERTACGKHDLSSCEAVGSVLPHESALRGACARSRPELRQEA